MVDSAKIEIRELMGSDVRGKIDEIAKLRIEVFREYPYLYDGNEAYEREYLQGLTQDKDALVIIAEDAGRVVAAATSLPLIGPADITQQANVEAMFKAEGLEPATFYYYSEILIRRTYRNAGISRAFYSRRDAFAKQRGFTNLCFAAITSASKERRPSGYFDPGPLWRKMGFAPNQNLVFSYEWPTLQADGGTLDQEHQLMFWIKDVG